MHPEGPLGSYEPPEGSAVHDSGWRVDPERASRGYAIALALGVVAVGGWLAWGASAPLDPSSADPVATARWVVGSVLLAIMGLGATKRCFGFGGGTAHALVMALLFQLATHTSGLGELGREALELVVAVPAGGGFAVALFLSWRHRRKLEIARQAVAAFAYFSLAIGLVRAATLRFELHRGLGSEAGTMVSAAVFLGAAIVAIPWLWRSSSKGSR